MANTYELITSTTVGSGGASFVTFSSIPATYTDLLIKICARTSDAQANLFAYFNNDTSASYSSKNIYGNGASATYDTSSSATFLYAGVAAVDGTNQTTNTFNNAEIYIPNYASSSQKSISSDAVMENNGTTAYASLNAGLWTGTSAITSVKLTGGTSFVQYSSFYLYGIKNS